MANPDLTRLDERKAIIEQIEAEENISRKRFEQRKFDIYRNRQAGYVLERLSNELSLATVQRMRKVLSINPCKRIIDQMGSLYGSEPERSFSNASEKELEQLENLYHHGYVDTQMRMANRYYKLHDQAALWVIPKQGKICVRALTPKDYDVVPDDKNPEMAFAYVLNVWDLDMRKSYSGLSQSVGPDYAYYFNDMANQKIADDSDRKQKHGKYVVWTDAYHFVIDRDGNFLDEPVLNPIDKLPFIDIASEKDFQFFVRRGNNVAEFTIDFLAQLSDLAETVRLQNFSQSIISSVEEPKDVVIGPNKTLWLKLDPNMPNVQPKFEFASPNPDLEGGLEILNTQLKMLLTSVGVDATTISGKAEARSFTSGIDHLLANIDKFSASKEDADLFRKVEYDLYELMRDWSNVMQPVNDETALIDDLRISQISDQVEFGIKYAEPHSVQTQGEKEDSVIKRLEAGLLTKKAAVIELYGFEESKAEEFLEEISEDKKLNIQMVQTAMDGGAEDESSEGDESGDQSDDRPGEGSGD